MNLPEKTYLTLNCALYESDFECNGLAKPFRIVQLLQDAATKHGEQLGVGWKAFDENGILWVLSKLKVEFDQPLTKQNTDFTLYTWPLSPNRFFAERCFCALADGKQIFSATSMWSIISREERKFLPAETMNNFFTGDYSTAHCTVDANYQRVRLDDNFTLSYERQIRRSDLDHNFHVNNTNYVTYAMDVLAPQEKVSALEIVYHKELKLGDTVKVFCRRQENKVYVVGQREETCFTAVLTVY